MLSRIGWTLLAALVSLTMRRGVRYGSQSTRWALVRWCVLKRDRFACRECRAVASYGGVWLEVDHRQRVADGGGYSPWNLRTLCKACHAGRHGG